jgi:dihydroneopterin aldolase
MDIIELKGIQLKTLIGVYPSEKEAPQPLFIDLAYAVSAAKAAEQDDLNKTIDYDHIIQHLKDFVHNTQFNLLETLAERLAQSLLAQFPTKWIKLSINKPQANTNAQAIILTIERYKHDQ